MDVFVLQRVGDMAGYVVYDNKAAGLVFYIKPDRLAEMGLGGDQIAVEIS